MPAQHPVLSPKVIKDLSDFFFEGFNDDDAAFYFNLPQPLISAIRAGSVHGEVRRGVIARKRYYVNKLIDGKKLHSGIVWFLERRFPREFAKPETQLGLVNGPAVNNTLVVSAELAEQIIARSRPIEDELTKLLKERDQRSLLASANNDASHTTNPADTPTIGVALPGEHELTCKELVKDGDARARERASLDGHHQTLKGGCHAPPVLPSPAPSPALPPSGKNLKFSNSASSSGENPKISDLSSDKLKISEVVVKRKPGRPKKKV